MPRAVRHAFPRTDRASARLNRLHNATVRVKEWQGEVVFLHEVVAGAADRSYGIQVAKLAGLPAAVIERAKLVLAKLEEEDRAAPKGYRRPAAVRRDASAATGGRIGGRRFDAVAAGLAALNPDEMSPRDAMEALYKLKETLAKSAKS